MSDAEWELTYWENSAGRAEVIRLIFEEAGISFKENNEDIIGKFYGGKLEGYPSFAVPHLRKGDLQISQTSVIGRYLGKLFKMYPEKEEDQLHCDQVYCTILDYITEGRNSFHAINKMESYFTQKEATQPYIDRFVKERIPKFLKHFEAVLTTNNKGNGFLFGNNLSYCDLGMLHVLRATESQFPEAWASADYIPALKAFKQRMETRPNISAYLKSDRWKGFEGNSMM